MEAQHEQIPRSARGTTVLATHNISQRQRSETGLRMSSDINSKRQERNDRSMHRRGGVQLTQFELPPLELDGVVEPMPLPNEIKRLQFVVYNPHCLDPMPEPQDILRFMLYQCYQRAPRITPLLSRAYDAVAFHETEELATYILSLPRFVPAMTLVNYLLELDYQSSISFAWDDANPQLFDYIQVPMITAYYVAGYVFHEQFFSLPSFSSTETPMRLVATLMLTNFEDTATNSVAVSVSWQEGFTIIPVGVFSVSALPGEVGSRTVTLDYTLPGTGDYGWLVKFTADTGAQETYFSLSYARRISAVPIPVTVTNTQPLWTSKIKPDPPLVMTRPLELSKPTAVLVLHAAFMIQGSGPAHAPVFEMSTQLRDRTIRAMGNSKKECQRQLKEKITEVFGRCDVVWHECVTVREYEAALHNKLMHTINGNTFQLSRRAQRTLAKANAMIEEGETPSPQEAKQLAQEIASSITLTMPEKRSRCLSIKELFEYFDGYGGDAIHVVHGTKCAIYLVLSAFDIDSEFLSELQATLCVIAEVLSTEEPKDQTFVDDLKKGIYVDAKPFVKTAPGRRVSTDPSPLGKPRPKPEPKPGDPHEQPQIPKVIDINMARQAKARVAQRIASKIPACWTALGYLLESTHSKEWKREVWQYAEVPDIVRSFGNVILESSVQTAALLATYVFVQEKMQSFLKEGDEFDFKPIMTQLMTKYPTIMVVREEEASRHNALMHAINGNIVRLVEKKAHNKLMHALNGNTSTGPTSKQDLIALITADTKDCGPIQSGDVITQLSNVPGAPYLRLADYTQANTAVFDTITGTGVRTLTSTWMPIYHLYNCAVVPAVPAGSPGGPLIFFDTIQAKGNSKMEKTATGTLMYDNATKNNTMLARADNKSFNGFYAIDLINMIQVAPLYDMNLEAMVLKWLCLYRIVCLAGLPQLKLPAKWDFYTDNLLDPNRLAVIQYNGSAYQGFIPEVVPPPAAAPRYFFPSNGALGEISFHLTVATVPPEEPYYFVPPTLNAGLSPFQLVVVLIALLSDFPSGIWTAQVINQGGAVVEVMDLASRFLIPGEQVLHIIMPSNGADRPPTTAADALRLSMLDVRTGPAATPTLAANAVVPINFVGGAIQTLPLADFLYTWFGGGVAWQNVMVDFITRLSMVYDVDTYLPAMYDLFCCLSNFVPGSTEAQPLNVGITIGRNLHPYGDFMMREFTLYDQPVAGAAWDFGYVSQSAIPHALIHALDRQAWNCIATGLWTQGVASKDLFRGFKIGHPHDFIVHSNVYSWKFFLAGQLWTMQLGLSADALAQAAQGVNVLPIYQAEVRAIFTSRQITEMNLMPCEGSKFMEAICANVMGFAPYKWTNQLGSLSVYDRYMFNGELWLPVVFVVPGPAVQTTNRWVPAPFADIWYNLLAKEVPLCLAMFDTVYNGVGTSGFALDNAFEVADVAAGTYVYPLMGDEWAKRLDRDNTRRRLDDKTLWNCKHRIISDYQALAVVYTMRSIEKNPSPAIPARLPFIANSPLTVATQPFMFCSGAMPYRDVLGAYYFPTTATPAVAVLGRRIDLGTLFANLTTIRIRQDITQPNFARQEREPIKLLYPVSKTTKVTMPASEVPPAGNPGNS